MNVHKGWLYKERKKRRISQRKVADILDIHPATVSAWELGKKKIPVNEKWRLDKVFRDIDSKRSGTAKFKKRIRKGTYHLSRGPGVPGLIEEEIISRKNYKKVKRNRLTTPLRAVSLFSGMGGMSQGFKDAGWNIIGHLEIDDSVKEIYQANFPDSSCLGTDITKVTNAEILRYKKIVGVQIDVLMGGPPCQGFSLAGKRNIFDPRNELFKEFVRIAALLKPRAILMENVKMMLTMKLPDGNWVKNHILDEFDKAGFVGNFRIVNAQDYGVPQFRERVIFVALNKDEFSKNNITFSEKTHFTSQSSSAVLPAKGKRHRTFRDATQDLERLESGEVSKKDRWHFAVRHPDHVIEMLKKTPEGKSAHENTEPSLRPTSGFNTSYKRLFWDKPSSTISTNFSMISGLRNVHPSNTRSITIREALRCQTFPDDFVLFGKLGNIRRGIGNAIPPLLAKIFAEHLDRILSAAAVTDIIKVSRTKVEL